MNRRQERLSSFRKLSEEQPDDHFVIDDGWEYVIVEQSQPCTYHQGPKQIGKGWSGAAVRWLYGGDVSRLGITSAPPLEVHEIWYADEELEYGITAGWTDDSIGVIGIAVQLEETLQVSPTVIEQVMRRCIDAGFYGAGFQGYDLRQAEFMMIVEVG